MGFGSPADYQYYQHDDPNYYPVNFTHPYGGCDSSYFGDSPDRYNVDYHADNIDYKSGDTNCDSIQDSNTYYPPGHHYDDDYTHAQG
jgi:hypothetical protein